MFGNVIGNLTQGELVQVIGRLIVRLGEDIHAGKFEDGAQLSEIFDIVQATFTDALAEYSDED
jgi:hypothetical protein